MIDPLAHLQAASRFRVRHHCTAVRNRYEILAWDTTGSGDLLAFAEQKTVAPRDQVTFFADEERAVPVFGFKARAALDVHGVTDVVDAGGRPIATFSKHFPTSLSRATWHLDQPGLPRLVGRERNAAVAVLRRLVLEFLPYRFDFLSTNGTPVMTVAKSFAFLRDAYDVVLHDDGLDRRVAAALAVALDGSRTG